LGKIFNAIDRINIILQKPQFHYVAVSLRNYGHWEEYNDFKHKQVPIPEQTKYSVQILLHDKENCEY
jgi:hypothetical protein